MCNVASTLGCRSLLGALAVFLLAGPFGAGSNPARADDKKKAAGKPHPGPQHKNNSDKKALVLPKAHANAHNHPPILAAMHHLEEAFAILEKHANPLFGDHRIAAMEYLQVSFVEMNLGIAGNPGPKQPDSVRLVGLPTGNDFPAIRNALGKVRAAQNELKKVSPTLNGHRRMAIIALNRAVQQLDLAMKHARSLEK